MDKIIQLQAHTIEWLFILIIIMMCVILILCAALWAQSSKFYTGEITDESKLSPGVKAELEKLRKERKS